MEPASRYGRCPGLRRPLPAPPPTPIPIHQAWHLLVLPVVVAVVATNVLDACQKVVQELKWAQGQVKSHYWIPSLLRPLNKCLFLPTANTTHISSPTLALLSLVLQFQK